MPRSTLTEAPESLGTDLLDLWIPASKVGLVEPPSKRSCSCSALVGYISLPFSSSLNFGGKAQNILAQVW
jgi:hypothetical protein